MMEAMELQRQNTAGVSNAMVQQQTQLAKVSNAIQTQAKPDEPARKVAVLDVTS